MDAKDSSAIRGYVTFRLGKREFAAALECVREVLRLAGLTALPGMVAPMAGVVELRGTPLPVMDLRSASGGSGDVLVLAEGDDVIGIAVDDVIAIRSTEDLLPSAAVTLPAGLPSYVVAILRDALEDKPVLLVDLRLLLQLVAA